jgi:hypothetical protein
VQYLLLSENNTKCIRRNTFIPERCQLDNLRAQTNYTCVAEILYRGVKLVKNVINVQTDLGSKYIVYVYKINKISFSFMGLLLFLESHRK